MFERPLCAEGHGSDCPDWSCTICGDALIIAPIIMLLDRRSRVTLRSRHNGHTRHTGHKRHKPHERHAA